MTKTDKGNQQGSSFAMDQRLDLRVQMNDVRKGVNVLNTSDPKNPAPNPFVQNQSAGQGTEPTTAGKQGASKNSE